MSYFTQTKLTHFFAVSFFALTITACQAVKPSASRSKDLAASKLTLEDTASNTATTLFFNGTVHTLNPAHPIADAFVIEGKTIKAVGPYETLNTAFTDSARIDLEGRTVLPGMIDSHVHVRELGMDRIKANLVGAKTTDAIIARLKAHYPNPDTGVWLIGQGWDEGYFGSVGYPDRAELDKAFPNNPVHLESLHGFAGFYNQKALEIASINKDSPNPDVGTILRRKNGEPTGVMLTLAQGLINQHIPEPSQTMLENAILAGLNEMASAGVTSIHEAGMRPQDVEAFLALAARDQLPIRVYGMLDGNNEALMSEWFENGIWDDPEDWLDIRGVKVFYDGSLGSRTALMKAPYSDEPGSARPTERISPARVKALAKRALQNGFQMAVHAIGDEGNNRTLTIYETAISTAPKKDHRFRIEHAQVVLPDYYKRAAKLGVLSSVESSHAMGDSAWAEDRIGPERIKHAYAWQNILKANGRLMLNSDLPGEPWTPMETLYFAVTRQKLDGTPEGGWYKNQALSINEALHAMTLENAYGAFQENKLGSLEVGKWADFIVVDKNPYKIQTSALKDIQIENVYVAGQKIR